MTVTPTDLPGGHWTVELRAALQQAVDWMDAPDGGDSEELLTSWRALLDASALDASSGSSDVTEPGPAGTPTDLATTTEAERLAVVEWLVATGYPFDWSTPDHPLPEPLRRPLAEAWLRLDGTEGEDVDDYLDSLEAEGAW